MSLGRRDFIIGSASVATTVGLLDGCDDGSSNPADGGVADAGSAMVADLPIDARVFAHGVASGDPWADGFVLWTRVSTATLPAIYMEWTVSTDPELRNVVQSTQIAANASDDYTVHVTVSGLDAGTTYYYAFSIPDSTFGSGVRSVIGRTRTLPKEADHARIAFTSCANYQNGYFNAYRAIAKRQDLDLWVHLGDYIYEYANGIYGTLIAERPLLPVNETITLADYRARYAHYRSDPDLQELHRLHPIVVVWDDHEFANNAYADGAENHMEPAEGSWVDRKRAASQAFLEWLPTRVPQADPVAKIFRTFAFADLFDLIMLDTRILARSKQAGADLAPGVDVGTQSQWSDPSRQLLGSEQELLFLQALSASRNRNATWRLIGNQVIFTQTRSPGTMRDILFSDFWDGYQPARQRVIDHILSQGIQNVVFLTGDIHSSWAMEISKDPFASAVEQPFAIELVGPSVTSLAFEDNPGAAGLVQVLLDSNLHVKFGEATRKGYVLLDVTPTRLQAEWYVVKDFKVATESGEELLKSFTCEKDSARLVAASSPSAERAGRPRPA